MLDSNSPDLSNAIRQLIYQSNEKRDHLATSVVASGVRSKRRYRDRQIRERRTFYAMFAFGLLLGGLELFIVLHYL